MATLETFANFIHGTHVSGISAKNAELAKLIALKIIPTKPPTGKAQPGVSRVHGDHDDIDDPKIDAFLQYAAQQNATLLVTAGKYTAATKADVANGSFGTSVAAIKPTIQNVLKQLMGRDPTDNETNWYSQYLVHQILTASKDFVAASPRDALCSFCGWK